MKLHEKFGIKKKLLIDIINIISNYENVEKVLIFGSRAKGTYKFNSDIDIAIFGKNLSKRDFSIIEDKINQLNTVLSFDIVYFENLVKKPLKENIIKDGVEIYVKR